MPIIYDFATRLPYVVRKPIEFFAGILGGLLGILKSMLHRIIKKITVYNEAQKKKSEFKPFKDLVVQAFASHADDGCPIITRKDKEGGPINRVETVDLGRGLVCYFKENCFFRGHKYTKSGNITKIVDAWFDAVITLDISSCLDMMGSNFNVTKKEDGGCTVLWSMKRNPSIIFQGCIEAEGSTVNMVQTLENAYKLDAEISLHSVHRLIFVPTVVMYSKKSNSPRFPGGLGPLRVFVKEKPVSGFCSSYEKYEASPENFEKAAVDFVKISQKFVCMNLIGTSTDSGYIAILCEGFLNKTEAKEVAEQKGTSRELNPFNIRFDNMMYKRMFKNFERLSLSLMNVECVEEVAKGTLKVEGANDGLNGVVQFVPAFVLFYKNAAKMIEVLNCSKCTISDKEKEFLMYCSAVSAFNAALHLKKC